MAGEGNIEDYPGFDIRLGRVCYHNIDVLTNEKILLQGRNFCLRDGIEFVLNKLTGQYEPWESFKSNFQKQSKITGDVVIRKLIDVEGFHWQNTYIIQKSPENCGHASFDQDLYDQCVTYFVYVQTIHRMGGHVHPWFAVYQPHVMSTHPAQTYHSHWTLKVDMAVYVFWLRPVVIGFMNGS